MNLSGAARQPINENMGNSLGLRIIDLNGETSRMKSSFFCNSSKLLPSVCFDDETRR